MSLHEQYYDLREKCWKAFEDLVITGCDYVGQLEIIVGKLRIRNKITSDTDTIIIKGIVANPEYSLHEGTNMIIGTNKIEVIMADDSIKKVTPDILSLDSLATYVSGGFSVYNDKVKS
jgi:hypothetical protein